MAKPAAKAIPTAESIFTDLTADTAVTSNVGGYGIQGHLHLVVGGRELAVINLVSKLLSLCSVG